MWAKKYYLTARSVIDATLRPHGIGSTQWYVLWHLVNQGSIGQRQLQDMLDIEKPTMSGVVSTLVRKGLIVQTVHPNDQRFKLLSMTSAGPALWDTLPDPIELIAATAFDDVPDVELEITERVLKNGVERLNNLLKKVKT
jgi:Transcriptional regulators